MFDMNFIFYCLFVTAIAIVLLFKLSCLKENHGKWKIYWITALGFTLLGVGIYFFPFGAIDAYEATRILWGLDYVQNSLLWYGITITLVIIGVILMKYGLTKRRRKK